MHGCRLSSPRIAPTPGTRRIERLEEDLGAAALALTAFDVAELDEASAELQVVGERDPEALQRMIDRWSSRNGRAVTLRRGVGGLL